MSRNFTSLVFAFVAMILLARPAGAQNTIATSTFLLPNQTDVSYNVGATVTCDATRSGSPSLINDGVTSITGWAGDVAWFGTNPDADARVNISGFNSAFDIVRIFSLPQDVPNPISIYCSSAVTTSLTVSDPTWSALGTFGSIPGSPVAPWVQYMGSSAPDRCYIDFHVSAPAGTRSLLVDLGTIDPPNTFGRIWEIELIHTTAVPEPGTLVLLAAGLAGLLCYAWRKRK